MCLIAYQPPGDPAFEPDVLANGWDGNPHGAGYMFAAGGVLYIRKAFYSLKKLQKAYMADHAAHGAGSAFVLHFRWATHGSREVGNVHPHSLANGQVGLAHNGILHDFDFGGKDSDTVTFCETVLACRTADNLLAPETVQFLVELIGQYNKFALMDSAGNVAIVNEKGGVWDGGRWYSNAGYLPPAPQAWTPLTRAWPVSAHTPPEPVTRGMVFDSTADALAAWRKRFDAAPATSHGTSLFDNDDWDSAGADQSYDSELEGLEMDLADAWQAGDEDAVDRIQLRIDELERERDQWANADLAMARDGR